MSFSFGGPQAPLTIRVCRALIWLQALLIILAGISVILAVLFFGDTDSIPFGTSTLSGSGAEILGGVYIAAGVVLAMVGIGVGRMQAWARVAVVSIQVFLAIVLVVRSLDASVSTFLNAGLFVAIVVLLYLPPSNQAFAGRTGLPRTAGPARAEASID